MRNFPNILSIQINSANRFVVFLYGFKIAQILCFSFELSLYIMSY